jgi:transposase
MTDHEWHFLRRLLPPGPDQGYAGRPIRGDIWAIPERPGIDPARARLDAIFRAVMTKRDTRRGPGRAAWTDAATPDGPKPDTIRRTFRRLAEAGFFHRLLRAVADLTRRGGRGRSVHARPGSFLLGLRYRACCAFRRIGVRRLGLAGLALARRLSLFSALPAHSAALPDRDLSAIYQPVISRTVARITADAERLWHPPKSVFRALRSMHRMCGGLARIRRDMEPA